MGEGRADFGRVQGVLPAYTADGEDPIKIGGRAWAALPTPSTNLYLVNTWHDLYGRIIVGFDVAAVTSTTNGPSTASITGITDTVVIASPALGTSIRISSIYPSNLDPTSNLTLTLKQGGLTKVISQVHTQGGGYVWSFEPSGWYLGSAQALTALLNTTSSAGVQVNVMWKSYPTPT